MNNFLVFKNFMTAKKEIKLSSGKVPEMKKNYTSKL